MGAAGAAGGAGLDVDEVFSTYLYTGNDTTRSITNGIDLSGEGGLVWFKSRTTTTFHGLFDTGRGATKRLRSDSTNAEDTLASDLTAFNSDGFTLGNGSTTNTSPREYASWTWRKAPKFFDVVTYTGNGSTQNISHNLGSVPGMIIIKCTSRSGDFWNVYHRSLGNNKRLLLQSTINAGTSGDFLNSTDPTSTQFTVGQESDVNASGQTYVAYLFAHNDGDGEFGPDSDQDIIKCGSYTGNGDSSGTNTVELGFEPQWLLIKRYDGDGDWFLMDVMRGMGDNVGAHLDANTSNAESSNGTTAIMARPTGFSLHTGSNFNGSNDDFIYMAIRRGPLAAPESATDVFSIDTQGGTSPTPPAYVANHLVDFAFFKTANSIANWQSSARLTQGRTIQLNSTGAEADSSTYAFDYQNGWIDNSSVNSNRYAWMWKRAPSYFDVVAYTGTGSGVRTINHNLGVAPEMIWIKGRNATMSWIVYHASLGNDYVMRLEQTSAASSGSSLYWNNTDPTSSVWTINSNLNTSGRNYIAYLFASLDGVSKCGSFSHTNGSTTNVDCGFSNGSKLVIIKSTDVTGHWYLFDSVRGIVSGNENYLRISLSNQQISADFIDPYSSGFAVYDAPTANYIFYAIAA